MNRKKEAKEKKKALYTHPYDLIENWVKGDFAECPWSQDKMDAFQKRLDAAFGAENAIKLVWSGDRTYGDALYTNWHYNGLHKGKLERKPVLLFKEVPINETDYFYISAPRFCLMEVHHGSQLENGWEESRWVSAPEMVGGRKEIRPPNPPEFYYVHLINGVLATHEQPLTADANPPCCDRLWRAKKAMCYGNYREPNEQDIAMIGEIRKSMDKAGVAQRNDAPRDARMIQAANLTTKHYIKRAVQQRASAVKEMMLASPDAFFGDIVKRKGGTMSARELERTVRDALNADEDQRFGKETTI